MTFVHGCVINLTYFFYYLLFFLFSLLLLYRVVYILNWFQMCLVHLV